MDLENIVHIRPLADCVKRSGCHGVDLPEIVKSLICEIEDRGLVVPNIYQKAGAKAGFIFNKVCFFLEPKFWVYISKNFYSPRGRRAPVVEMSPRRLKIPGSNLTAFNNLSNVFDSPN